MSFLKYLIFCFIFCSLSSCLTKNEFTLKDKPSNLLTEEKFTAAFSDMILLESSANQQAPNLLHTQKVMNISSPEILRKHNISKKQYVDAFEYYAEDKEKMNEIYTKILDNYNIELSKIK